MARAHKSPLRFDPSKVRQGETSAAERGNTAHLHLPRQTRDGVDNRHTVVAFRKVEVTHEAPINFNFIEWEATEKPS